MKAIKEKFARVENEKAVSVIVVLYNSSAYIEQCFKSLGKVTYRPIELITVDNGSEDDSVFRARKISNDFDFPCVFSCLGRNKGFAKASNIGAAISSGDILFFLNPDTEIFPDAINALVEAFNDDSVGIAGCRIYYPDRMTLQHTGGFIRDNGLTMHYGFNEIDTGQYSEVRDVQYVTGAAIAVRKDIFTKVGMFDTGYYPAYFEETDLCLKVRRLKYRVVYVPGARVIHHESTTTGRFTERYYYLYHKNRIRFILKNFSLNFILNRALPLEQKWIGMINPEEQALPLNKAYIANILRLPVILLSRWRTEKLLSAPRIEDTVSEL